MDEGRYRARLYVDPNGFDPGEAQNRHRVRLGALSVKTGAAGTLYWDEFVSRRSSYIGP